MAHTRTPAYRRLATRGLPLGATIISLVVTPSLVAIAQAAPSATTTGPGAAVGAVAVDRS